MSRIGRLTVCLLALFVTATSCGDSGSGDGQQSGRTAIPDETVAENAERVEAQGRPAIPPEPPETVEGLKLEPYFDEEGTQTSKAVSVGELFSLYICATHPNVDIKTAQWRLEVPEGIEIIGEAKQWEQALSIGAYDTMFLTTFPCQTDGKTKPVLKYNCVAAPNFAGGEFRTVKAGATHGHSNEPPFLGFVTCTEAPEMVPAEGGVATVSKK